MAGGRIMELQKKSSQWDTVVDQIVRLEKKIFPKHESLSRFFHEGLRKNKSGLLYYQFDDGEVAGYVMYSFPSSLIASITKLAVRENHRRQGFGEELLKAAIHKCKCRNVQQVTLHVDPSRSAAMNLYIKIGFQIECLIPNYYSSDRSAYKMFLGFDHSQHQFLL